MWGKKKRNLLSPSGKFWRRSSLMTPRGLAQCATWPSPDHSASTRPKEPAGLAPQNDSSSLSYTLISGCKTPCLTPSSFSLAHPGHLDVTAGTRVPETQHPAPLCIRVVSATRSAITHAETRPSLPGGTSRNAPPACCSSYS